MSSPGAAMLRRGAWAVAAGRVALGLAALARPSVPARPWVGATADELTVRVFGRALGARDVALGAGALVALRRQAAEPLSARAWVAAGALSDALDVVASLASWRGLPRTTRWLVVASAGGAALAGAAGALVLERSAMSDHTPSPGNPGDTPDGEPDVLDEAQEAEMMRAVMRAQERHREGGIDRELDGTDEDPEPGA